VHLYSYTSRIIQHRRSTRAVRTVVVAKRFDNEDSCMESKGNNNDHDHQNDDVGRCLPITNARRIDEVGYDAMWRSGRWHSPVVNGRVHVVRSSSSWASS
jgi:hypothetical protein